MKQFFSYLLLICLCVSLLFSCGGKSPVVSSTPEKESPVSSSVPEKESSVPSSEPSSPESSTESSDDEKIDTSERDSLLYTGGPINMCQAHNPWFHTIPGRLLPYVGDEIFDRWVIEVREASNYPDYYPTSEDVSIVKFIEDFHITKDIFLQYTRPHISEEDLKWVSEDDHLDHVMTEDEYYNRYSFTDTEIEALFSGDKRRINEIFCGPLGFVNEADGEIYSIYWLADHTADDYVAAGLPLDKVQDIIEAAQTGTNQICRDLGKAAEATLEEAEAIEAGTGCGSTLKEKYSFHYYNVDGSLIDFIGADTFDAWWKKNKGQDLSILNVVRDFQIPKETFLSVTRPELDEKTLTQLRSQGITLEEWYPYTLEEIDAIYSGEEATVNRVFCSPIAVFNETNGQIYTLSWLASHTAEEYQSVGLSSQAIQEVLNRIQSDDEYAEWRTVAKQVEPILEKAESIETAASKKLVE